MDVNFIDLQSCLPLSLYVKNPNIIDVRYSITSTIQKTNDIYFSCIDTSNYVTTARINKNRLLELYKVLTNRYRGFSINLPPHLKNSVYQSYSIKYRKYTHLYLTPTKEWIDSTNLSIYLKENCEFILRYNNKELDQVYLKYYGQDYDNLWGILDDTIIEELKQIEKPAYLIFYTNKNSNWRAYGFLAGYVTLLK